MNAQISIHHHAEVRAFCVSHMIDLHLLRRFRTAYYKHASTIENCLLEIPAQKRALFKERIQFSFLTLQTRRDSALDGCSKLAFVTEAGHLIETVILRIGSGRTSLCISSQVGCAAKCAFCATGQMEKTINLTTSEILDQIIQANTILRPENRMVRNVVFMGMGEPFHNYETVCDAVSRLKSPQHFNITSKRIIVSTVGVAEKMLSFTQKHPDIGLALSLHSAIQETRAQLIPWAKRCNLEKLHRVISEINTVRPLPLMLEYLMLESLTDTDEHLSALVAFATNLNVHINLIPYNSNPQTPLFIPSTPERIQYCAQELKKSGLKTTVRYSLGSDIEAACGQLVQGVQRKD